MKRILYSLILTAISVVTITCLTSCGGGGGGDDGGSGSGGSGGTSTSKTYRMSITIDATAQNKTITLSDVKNSISSAVSSASWLTVERETYTSGSPKITISATANSQTTSRTATITVTASNNDKVILTVTQDGKEAPSITKPNDEVSYNEAYSIREASFE